MKERSPPAARAWRYRRARRWVTLCLASTVAGSSLTNTSCGGNAENAASGPPSSGPPRAPHKSSPTTEEEEAAATDLPRRWCAQQRAHAFCADFDGAALRDGWDILIPAKPDGFPGQLPGSGYEAVTSDRSGPNALSIFEPPVAEGESRGGPTFSHRVAVPRARGARVSLDLRIDQLGVQSDVYALAPVRLAFKRLDGNTLKHAAQAQLQLRGTRTELLVSPGKDDDGAIAAAEGFPHGRWVHLAIELDLASTPAIATMKYDGRQASSCPLGAVDPNLGPVGQLALDIGMTLHSPHPDRFVAAFDNVVLELL